MASPARRWIGWILLLAALAQPGWVAAHALDNHDQQQHGHGTPSGRWEAEALDIAGERTAREHDHLDDAILVGSRNPRSSGLVALPSLSPEPVGLDRPLCVAAADGARPRAGPERGAPSHPRAPPRA